MEEEFNLGRLGGWLGITEQQNEILRIVYKLEKRRQETSPKNIDKEYTTMTGKYLAKPNLFHLLRGLLEKDLMVKDGRSNYRVNFDGVRRILGRRGEHLEKELDDFQNTYRNVEEYMRKASFTQPHPVMKYYNYHDRYRRLIESLKDATAYYTIGKVPNICLTYPVAEALGKDEYVKMLWDRCFKDKTLEVTQITDLNVRQLYAYTLKAVGKPEPALKEAHIILDNLESQVNCQEKLTVRYFDGLLSPLYLKIQLIEHEKPDEFFLNLHSERDDATVFDRAYLYVKSAEAASYVKEMVQKAIEDTQVLKGRGGLMILKKKRIELDRIRDREKK